MPALDALLSRTRAAHTVAVGISVDSRFSHAAWGASLGGIRLPLLADFHPKGAVATAYGVYLDQAGMAARSTVLVSASGIVKHASIADGQRDMAALVQLCEEIDGASGADLPPPDALPAGLAEDAALYVKNNCIFSRNALYTRANLGLEGKLRVVNVSEDDAAAANLVALGGKNQAPALVSGSTVRYESKDIQEVLVSACALPV